MKNKVVFILGIAFIIIFLLSTTTTFAGDFTTQYYEPVETQDYEGFAEMGGNIISVIKYVGIIIGVVIIAVIGIKYMLGSIEEKAEYKQTIMPFFIGAILLISTPILLEVIFKTMGTNAPDSVADVATKISHEIVEGEKEPSELTNTELLAIYSNNQIERDIGTGLRKGKTIKEIVAEMSEDKQKIYNEVHARQINLTVENREGEYAAQVWSKGKGLSEIQKQYMQAFEKANSNEYTEGEKAYWEGYSEYLKQKIHETEI